MSRESFLARVHAAANAGRAFRVDSKIDAAARVGYAGAGEDPVARFLAEFEAVGGHAERVPDIGEAGNALRRLLRQFRPRSALCWRSTLLDRIGLEQLLVELEIERLDYAALAQRPTADQREAMLAAEIGVSSVSFAVAETGSLVVGSRPGQERLASLAPPAHIAVLEAADLLPDLFDLFDRLACQPEPLPSNLALITGPSKTGDLELTLTTGVHGPGAVHVIVVG